MDINAALSLRAVSAGAQYKTAQPAEQGNFNKIFSEVSSSWKKQAVKPNKNDRKLQENYDSVLASSGMNYNQVKINDYTDSVNETEELVMGVSEDLSADTNMQAAFGDITKAFSDMISTELLSQYIMKNYPDGTAGQNPMEEFSAKVSEIMYDAIEDRSGFTKTQMTNPNMTIDIIGLDKIVNDSFVQEITDDIVSVVLKGDVKDTDLTGQIVKSAFNDILADPARFVTMVNKELNTQETPVSESGPQISDIPQPDIVNVQPEATQNTVQAAAPEVIPDAAENTQSEPEVRMILMSDGTYIPETSIMKSGLNVPDEKGIYPAGTEYIEATPLIGKGNSPASAVLMAKVGDEDGLIRPSDFVKARNITFTKHENVFGKSAPSVYMPINGGQEAVSGVIEYKGEQSDLMNMAQGEAQDSGTAADLLNNREKPQNDDFIINDNAVTMNAPHTPQIHQTAPHTEVFDVRQTSPSEMISQMAQKLTENIVNADTEGVKQMQIQLQPETLGNIVIKLESVQGEVSVKIITSNPEVRGMIEQSVAQMSESIKAQGVNLNNINVSSAAEQRENFDGSGGNSAYYNDSQQNQRQQQEEKTNYKEYMEAAENEKIRKVLDSIRSMGI